MVGDRAPELAGISGWINSEPFSLASQRGKVVLIDFWTYTCINCIRTFPFLRDWQERYADDGLVIIGVHTPEFDFEKITENVRDAAAENQLLYPIVQDNDYTTWRAFDNHSWPAKYLIDKDGIVRYTHFGEGAYDETEIKIRELLEETGASFEGRPLGTRVEREYDERAFSADVQVGLTRELYAGVERNYGALQSSSSPPYLLQTDYYEGANTVVVYEDPGDHLNHFLYLEGEWFNGLEGVRHARQTQDFEDYIAIKFFGTSVNAVMSPGGGAPFVMRATLDDQPFQPDQAGADIRWDAEGNSFVAVDVDRLYRIVKLGAFAGHELRLSSNADNFTLFAFTFGAFDESTGSME